MVLEYLNNPHAILSSVATVLAFILGIISKKGFSSLSHLLKLIPLVLADGKVTKEEAMLLLKASRGFAISILISLGFVSKDVIKKVDEAVELYEEIKEIKNKE